ncbi:MAG: hypothetical protein ABI068_15525, partial [Ktedonobacterales bacterium]
LGQTLILLIEDFATLQGVDTALLQALIEAPGEGPNALCELRWAMAVTSGYYERLPDTVKSRMDFLIDMDLPTSGEFAVLGPQSVTTFAARYLNAVRLDERHLHDWYVERSAVDTPSASRAAPNQCDSCQFREECHRSFGEAHGVGLYPFNEAALNTMAERQDRNIRERFNPRRLIKNVLAEVMGAHRQELVSGEFPDERLLAMMGGSQLTPATEDRLNRQDPVNFPRQRATLELWGIPGKPINVPTELYEAFALQPPVLEQTVERQPAVVRAYAQGATAGFLTTVAPVIDSSLAAQPITPPIATPPERAEPLHPDIHAIRRWAQGEAMPEDTATWLRDALYAALLEAIDWDAAGFERIRFMQPDGSANIPFRRRNIIFRRQRTQSALSGVILTLPLNADDDDDDDELRQTAIALEALRQFQLRKAWDFPDAFEGLAALGECLSRWSTWLLDAFRRWPTAGTGKWDAISAAVETLAVGAAMSGRLAGARVTSTDALNAIFEPLPDLAPEQTSKEWRALYAEIQKRQESAREILEALAFAAKGGRVGKMLDPSKLLPPLKRIMRRWEVTPPATNDTDLRDPYLAVAKLHRRIGEQLTLAATVEYERRVRWLDQTRQYMDEQTTRLQVVTSAEKLLNQIEGQGIEVNRGALTRFRETLNEFKRVQLDAAIQATQQLREKPTPVSALPMLASNRTSAAMEAATAFFAAADALNAEVEAAVATNRATLVANGGEKLASDRQMINDSLATLERAFQELGGDAC